MSRVTTLDRPCRGASCAILAILLALAAIVGTGGAETINFADLSLASNSYWNGSDGSGGFSSGGAFFNNSYDSDYGSWSGWSYSNVNYSNTSFELDPIGNPWYQFAAVTGTGVGGNAIYAVGYGNSGMLSDGVLPTIAIPNGMQVQSAMFTNTTYAAASMLNGDQFAKQFGPSDWFLLTISGLNSSGSSVGSVNYYLASSGTITTKWQTVNLSSLSLATSLEFDLHSSDTGLYGMNTPAYFAMDDLVLSPASSATGGSWINPQGGTWGSGPNWSGGSLPSGGAGLRRQYQRHGGCDAGRKSSGLGIAVRRFLGHQQLLDHCGKRRGVDLGHVGGGLNHRRQRHAYDLRADHTGRERCYYPGCQYTVDDLWQHRREPHQ